MATKALLNILFLFLVFEGVYCDLVFYFENKCQDGIWLASSPYSILSDVNIDPHVWPDEIVKFNMNDPWTGGIWARTNCINNKTGFVDCETGDCGTGMLTCKGPQPIYPVTFLNFGINQNMVSYEVSLIHGHNIGVRIAPNGGSLAQGGSGPCPVVDCIADISNVCPASLVAYNKEGYYVGCNSACDGLKDCQPNNKFTQMFKQQCGLSHIFPGDSSPPLYTCNGATSYNITFCPF